MKVLVANRGEIACRILRCLRELGIPGVAVYSESDREAPHVRLAPQAVALGGKDGYLDARGLIDAAKKSGATALHPGYGFLAENAAFARSVGEAGLTFIGPSPDAMVALGDKRKARQKAEELGVPVVPGEREADSAKAVEEAATRLGYPILLKAAAGGGGRGMRRVNSAQELASAQESARREAEKAFSDGRLLVEKYVSPARHVEVQILADGKDAVVLGERECSLQRRHQKVIEEAPSPGISEETRNALREDALKLARAANYASAGTVEFLVDANGAHYFLEVNTRLQVEHPVTEMVTGIDIVRAQVDLARGGNLPAPAVPRGHAIEARLYAEDPYRGYLPQSGKVLMLHWPALPGVRIDSGIREGSSVGDRYDPLLAKVIAWGPDRPQARRRLVEALRESVILGFATNQAFLIQVLESDFFGRGETFTTTLELKTWKEPPVPEEVVAAAQRAMGMRSSDGGGGDDDPYSPWAGMGPFRMGS